MKNDLITLVLLTVMFCCGCKTENEVEPLEPRQGENFIFYTSKEKYREAITERTQSPGSPFKIKSVLVLKNVAPHNHDVLEITVSHYPGCGQNFEMIWDGTILESFPEQINIFLTANGECDDGKEQVETVLLLDLDEFIGRSDLVDSAIFHIVNGSMASPENDQSVSDI